MRSIQPGKSLDVGKAGRVTLLNPGDENFRVKLSL